ncbi:TldD/PmbA family protein [bacterium]|jgi:PmbA protein|nr:TldD/PmbA family protein [bacterium]
MIGVDKARSIFQEAKSQCGSDLQVMLSGGKKQLARIGKNHVYQNLMKKDYTLKVQVADGQKVGNASCNRFFGKELLESIQKAELIASHQKEDPDFCGFHGSDQECIDDKFYCEKTIAADFQEKLKGMGQIFEDASARNVEVAGAFSHGDSIACIGNSHGLFQYHVCTDANFTLSIMTPQGGSGWAESHSHELSKIRAEELYERALQKALASEKPGLLPEGEYTVILEPPAVESLVMFLGYLGLGGLPCAEGRSYFSGKVGQQVLGENITLIDDYLSPESFGCPFDFEGSARSRQTLIENGKFMGPVLDRSTAKKLGFEASTGHALPYPSRPGPLPLNLGMQGGDQSLDEMVKNTKRGILVTRFFYDNVIDPGKMTITGMTRDGTFLIEDGEISTGLKNLRYNESLPRVFQNVAAISKDKWSLRGFGRTSLPALKIEGFKFTGQSS